MDPSVGRSCFNQDNDSKPLPSTNEAVIVVDENDHPNFPARKCSTHYFRYYDGKAFYTDANGVKQPITAANCSAHQDDINLRQGYAPLPVMFRGTKSQLAEGIAGFRWELYGPLDSGGAGPLLKTSDAFNLAYIFETPGEYKAVLKVFGSKGGQSSTSTNVTVWPRDKKTYYVDSVAGDDRFDGLSQSPQGVCDVNTAAVGTCHGPWKTATRSFSELGNPYNVASYPGGKYVPEQFCASTTQIIQASQYNAGFFKTYRSQVSIPDMILSLTKADGSKLVFGPYNMQTCAGNSYVSTRASILNPGDQILFKRGQTFEMNAGIYETSSYTADVVPDASTTACAPIAGSTNVRCSYESVRCHGSIATPHWPKAIGIHFGAYGDVGLAKPKIQNIGSAACIMLDLEGIGGFNLSMQDLAFDMYSDKVPALDNEGNPSRSLFMFSPGSSINLSFNRLDLTRFEQGIVLSNEHGVFIQNSSTYDSRVVHFFIGSGSDISLENNKFDYSGNHLAYTGMSNAVVINNIFSKPAFGRTGLRVDGAGGLKNPNRYVWVSDNKFLGWIDPRTQAICLPGRCPYSDGKSYNYTIVHFGPNAIGDLANRDTIFIRNIVKDAQTFMTIGNNENLTVKDNYFSTPDTSAATRINLLGSGSTVRRPNKNILFENNTFIDSSSSGASVLFSLTNYADPTTMKCDDIPNHRAINLINNSFYFAGKQKVYHYLAQRAVTTNSVTSIVSDLTEDQGEVEVKTNHVFENNKIYSSTSGHLFQMNGSGYFSITPKGFGGSVNIADAIDPLKYSYRAYSFEGASLQLGYDKTKNSLSPAALTYPAEPF